jgi:twitching motility protein PilT
MSLITSLLQAIVRVDGEALVMHVGDKPYVVSPKGQIDLASKGLTLDAVNGIVNQLLPADLQRALEECGAVQHELPPSADFPGETFTVVAARGGDDVWAEVRRRLTPEDDSIPLELFDQPVGRAPMEQRAPAPPTPAEQERARLDDDLALPASDELWAAPSSDVREAPPATIELASAEGAAPAPAPEPETEWSRGRGPAVDEPLRELVPAFLAAPVEEGPRDVAASEPPETRAEEAPPHAVVVPLARNSIRTDTALPSPEAAPDLNRLLRLAAARGASTLYVTSSARPTIRVDGDIQAVEGAPPLAPNDVEALLLTLMPERKAEAFRSGVASEWMCEVVDVGRVRCLSFRDHLGPGGVFRMMPTRAVTADHLGLSREVQGLAMEPEGLLLVAGPRGSGKRTLIAALVDLVNRTRRDHVVTIEREISVVHDRMGSFISQREVRGGVDDMAPAARAALREDPDVLVLEELQASALMDVALEAAASGHLVIGGIAAHTASGAVDRIVDFYPAERRRQVELALAQNLLGVLAQVLLRKNGGGRVAAREVLLGTATVREVLAEGKTSQLPLLIEAGRQYGMVPLNDALVGFVQAGLVEAPEAYRRAGDRPGFLALLKRHGHDTSLVERLA